MLLKRRRTAKRPQRVEEIIIKTSVKGFNRNNVLLLSCRIQKTAFPPTRCATFCLTTTATTKETKQISIINWKPTLCQMDKIATGFASPQNPLMGIWCNCFPRGTTAQCCHVLSLLLTSSTLRTCLFWILPLLSQINVGDRGKLTKQNKLNLNSLDTLFPKRQQICASYKSEK